LVDFAGTLAIFLPDSDFLISRCFVDLRAIFPVY